MEAWFLNGLLYHSWQRRRACPPVPFVSTVVYCHTLSLVLRRHTVCPQHCLKAEVYCESGSPRLLANYKSEQRLISRTVRTLSWGHSTYPRELCSRVISRTRSVSLSLENLCPRLLVPGSHVIVIYSWSTLLNSALRTIPFTWLGMPLKFPAWLRAFRHIRWGRQK